MTMLLLLTVIIDLSLFSRYPSLILWPFTPLEVLNQRLDDRVNNMAKVGETFTMEPPTLLTGLTERLDR